MNGYPYRIYNNQPYPSYTQWIHDCKSNFVNESWYSYDTDFFNSSDYHSRNISGDGIYSVSLPGGEAGTSFNVKSFFSRIPYYNGHSNFFIDSYKCINETI